MPSDSAKQPQNLSPVEGRKNQTLKHQSPCEVLPCGTFLKITVLGDSQGRSEGRGGPGGAEAGRPWGRGANRELEKLDLDLVNKKSLGDF